MCIDVADAQRQPEAEPGPVVSRPARQSGGGQGTLWDSRFEYIGMAPPCLT